eukprot:COSAG05_NODE_15268_length_373_cov_20192.379562_1_plen_62_part_01
MCVCVCAVLVNYSYISKVSADLVDAAVTTSADDGSFSEASVVVADEECSGHLQEDWLFVETA